MASGSGFTMHETNRTLRGHGFLPEPAELARLPKLYAQDAVPPQDTMIYLHYFGGPFDFWVAEGQPDHSDPEEPDFEFFGYVRYEHMPDGAEWGYQSARYLEEQVFRPRGFPFVVERDIRWKPKPMWECHRSGLYNRHGYHYVDLAYRDSSQKTRAEMCRRAHQDHAPDTAAIWHEGRWWTVDSAPPRWRVFFGLYPLPESERLAALAREETAEPWTGRKIPGQRG
jgi:hypothetical protein